MKRNINKVVAIGIGLSILGGSINPVFAAKTTEDNQNISSKILTSESNSVTQEDSIKNVQDVSKPILTLDKIITAAIANSDKLTLKTKEITMYENKMNLQDKTNDFYNSINQKVYDFPYDKLELQEKQTDQEREFLQDQIASDITNKYNAIIMKQIDLNKSKTNLEIKNKDLGTMKTKIQIGMATSNQLSDKQIEINSLQDDITAKENSLKNNMDYLGVLTNLKLSDYNMDQSINYNVFIIDGSIDEYLDDKIEKYFKYNDQMITLTKDYLNELKDDDIKDIVSADIPSAPDKSNSQFLYTDSLGNPSFDYGKYAISLIQYQQNVEIFSKKLAAYGSYLDARYGMDTARVKLEDSKKSLKNGLKEGYSTLLDLENKIKDLNDTINSTNTKLKYAKSQVDIGMMTENNYKAQVLKSEDLDTSLRQLINTYNNLKNSIQKPWVLSSN